MKTCLVVDIGNTRVKAAIFTDAVLSEKIMFSLDKTDLLEDFIKRYQPTHSLLSSVSTVPLPLVNLLQQHTSYLQLSHTLKFPFENKYATPQTLGMDRIAGIAGALLLFQHQHCLVIDAGTCVTFDFVTSDNQYLGGAISPGLQMRLDAMHHFTNRLPEFTAERPVSFIGDSTRNSMLSGAYYGMLGEINATIARYEEQFANVQVLLCGGDAPMFDKQTKKSIFAAPDLVLYGLFKILQLNAT